ncbi:MAG TPA: aldo/keto reductase [Novosphingobium sp.]|nr:aldo/keto reductase [Novosphingobium sp.]HMP56391.1 aldo/keto reductase [Novosphingobium sp.]
MPAQLDDYRLLGRSGLRVSPLTLGTMTFAVDGWGSSDEEAARMVDTYIDRGGNFIDTANYYGAMGGSEVLLGKLLAGRRDRVVISTKYSLTTQPGNANASGNHRRNMVRAVEDSLRRLGTDYIDLYYLHMWDFRTPVDEILRAFDDLVSAGKIVYIGLSDTPAWQASRMQMMAELRGWSQFCALQISYSLIERTVERELIPMAAETGMGVCPWSPLGGGVLSGKYSQADLADTSRDMTSRRVINLATGRLSERSLAIARVVGEVAAELGCTSPQVALAWTMLDHTIASPVLGARTPGQLEDNLGSLAVDLSADQVERLNAVSAVPLGFPHEMLSAPTNAMAFGNVRVERR